MKAGFVYDEIYLKHDYPDHPERKERLISIVEHMEKSGLMKEVSITIPITYRKFTTSASPGVVFWTLIRTRWKTATMWL